MHASTRRRGVAATILAALVLAGCAAGRGELPSPTVAAVGTSPPSSPTAAPTRAPTAPPLATEPPLSGDPWIAKQMKVRSGFGLQWDEAWVLAVASDPRASSLEHEMPMLPEELRYIEARPGIIESRIAFASRYGDGYPESFAGAANDAPKRDLLVVLFTDGDLEAHRQRLQALAPDVRLEVRRASWTLAELEELRPRIVADTTMHPEVDVYAADIEVLSNRLRVHFSADDGLAGTAMVEAYAPGMVLPIWTGPAGPVDVPMGKLVVEVVDGRGDPLEGLECRYASIFPTIPNDGGSITGPRGICRLLRELYAGRYRISIAQPDELVERVLATAEVEVEGNETTRVTIVVPHQPKGPEQPR